MSKFFKCVFFDEDNGASVQEIAHDELTEHHEEGEEIPDDDDEDAWMQLTRSWDNGDCRCIMTVDDARNAAMHILQLIGGMSPPYIEVRFESITGAEVVASMTHELYADPRMVALLETMASENRLTLTESEKE